MDDEHEVTLVKPVHATSIWATATAVI